MSAAFLRCSVLLRQRSFSNSSAATIADSSRSASGGTDTPSTRRERKDSSSAHLSCKRQRAVIVTLRARRARTCSAFASHKDSSNSMPLRLPVPSLTETCALARAVTTPGMSWCSSRATTTSSSCCRYGNFARASLATSACSRPATTCGGKLEPNFSRSSVRKGPTKKHAPSSRPGPSRRSTHCSIGTTRPASMIWVGERCTRQTITSHAFSSRPLSSEHITSATRGWTPCQSRPTRGTAARLSSTPYSCTADEDACGSLSGCRSRSTQGMSTVSIESCSRWSPALAQLTRSRTWRPTRGSARLPCQISRMSVESSSATETIVSMHCRTITHSDSRVR
mmetsp:Transcript_51212/g.147054  ORF Transcript_51212/g.147054 Transcript_51212/m.147054 type:complete len:338 (-) Transcript_51212:64-1077(-)